MAVVADRLPKMSYLLLNPIREGVGNRDVAINCHFRRISIAAHCQPEQDGCDETQQACEEGCLHPVQHRLYAGVHLAGRKLKIKERERDPEKRAQDADAR